MTRHAFGGGSADWAITAGPDNVATLNPAATLTFWDAQTGGTQQDIALDSGGVTIVSSINSADGSGSLMVGQVPVFWGPDDVWKLWMKVNAETTRSLIQSSELSDLLNAQTGDADSLRSNIQAFQDSLGANSGIATLDEDGTLTDAQVQPFSLASATDVNLTGLTNGNTIAYDTATSKWKPRNYPSSWTTFTLASGYSSFGVAPAWRFIGPDTIELAGRVQKTGGGAISGPVTLVTNMGTTPRPTTTKYGVMGSEYVSGAGNSVMLEVQSGGAIVARWASPGAAYNPAWISFDGFVYDIAT